MQVRYEKNTWRSCSENMTKNFTKSSGGSSWFFKEPISVRHCGRERLLSVNNLFDFPPTPKKQKLNEPLS